MLQSYLNKVIQGDCLQVMKNFEDKSIDMILCDLPYGTTQNKWDSVIPLDDLWKEYKRIIKDKNVPVWFDKNIENFSIFNILLAICCTSILSKGRIKRPSEFFSVHCGTWCFRLD